MEKLLRKNQNGFEKCRSAKSKITAFRRIMEGVRNRTLTAAPLFVDYSEVFASIHQTEMTKIINLVTNLMKMISVA